MYEPREGAIHTMSTGTFLGLEYTRQTMGQSQPLTVCRRDFPDREVSYGPLHLAVSVSLDVVSNAEADSTLNSIRRRLFVHLPRGGLLGNRERIFMRGCIKVPAPKVHDRGKVPHLAPILTYKGARG